ncbi:Aminobenzoyl-glutamate utilization protein B [Brevundimonas diminuta]|uniref:amidohydrolase n=1 Tax=Brevundimonas diminuta TaxID=293 RepID=UPI000207F68B|nr:amidohydrolase [Brevundimonas diminuta]EGF95170.1 aminobenzoyl-glutamate utilization protein B [Brevundimonas diminuta ATCC 11568]MBD3818878.1 amidohydrolase [Brevundimonas diminuta]WQE46046.1 amidohydrolase [Brevundimonas diminuta]SPU47248.1 Aminobenzoyl-glutamate utilization protein B [Brevundimonas diminuta]SUW15282.1 Aminobenzoyl-glutamate utilization protein B [Brevundimonas diminuta]
MKPVSMRALALAAALAGVGVPALAGELSPQAQQQIVSTVDRNQAALDHAALEIWKFAELGYQETQSSALLQGQLRDAGFTVTPGIANEPTAFLASFKNGSGPVIAVLAEYDALPGLSQTLSPIQESAGGHAGHGCGHNLFGAASIHAAIAVKDWMVANNIKGELRVYGTPAEEGGSGKVYMVRDGLFDDVDVSLHWHPGNVNSARQGDTMANVSGKFRFYGTASHAAAAPDKGRSALDGVEAMNAMVNLMREHVPDRTRIHYAITDGGKAPNVVPAYAEAYYYVRHNNPEIVRDVLERVKLAADGAALGTGTRVEFEAIGGVYSMLPNEALMHVMDRNLRHVGGITWTAEETALASEIQKTLTTKPDLASVGQIEDAVIGGDFGGSTDVSDVSWVTPTVGLSTATFVPGSAGHSWQNVVAAGSTIGLKGAHLAAKTLALTTAELFQSPETIQAAKAEFERRRGPDFQYRALLGDRAPALNYRD